MLYTTLATIALAFNVLQATATTPTTSHPQVKLDHGTFLGAHNGSVDAFLGIPFAKPP